MAAAPEDQTGLMWSDPAWPWRPLNRVTAMQYFEHSPFYDPNSNNAAARAQNLDPSNEAVLRALPPERPEFVMAEVQEPHLFVIRRQLRAPPPAPGAAGAGAGAAAASGRAATQAVYYVLGEAMAAYQAPTLHAAVNARLRRCMHFVRVGFGRFKRDLAPLPKLLRARERRDAEAAELEAREARERGVLKRAVATGALGADAAAQVEAAGAGGGGLAALQSAEDAPMELPEVLSLAERRHWERTDEIIMSVLRRYQAPRLPLLDSEAEAAAKAAEAAAAQQQEQAAAAAEAGVATAAASAAAAAAAAGGLKAEPKQEAATQQQVKPEGGMRQPAARPAASVPQAAAAAPGVGLRGSHPGVPTGSQGSGLPASSQAAPQPSGGSVLTASRAPKVRIKLPRSSGGGGSSGGGAAPGSGGGGDQPAAKRAKQ